MTYLSEDKQIILISRLPMGCPPGTKPFPKYMQNFFKEYMDDLEFQLPRHGDLSAWKDTPIALMNFKDYNGYQLFEAIQARCKMEKPCVFILMGAEPQALASAVSGSGKVLKVKSCASYQAAKGFFGCKMFTQVCDYLKLPKDVWRLP